MNKALWGGFLCVVAQVGGLGAAQAQMIKTSGRIALPDGAIPDGAKITAQVDINRNGKLEAFESVSATVKADGTYKLDYVLDPASLSLDDLAALDDIQKIVAKYEAGGFEALVAEGPLQVVVTIEREGYSTVVERFSTMGEAPKLDVMLEKLPDVRCAGDACASSSGGVVLSGFSSNMGAATAYAETYAPGRDKARFPGTFSDDADNLLVSSGFTEISLFDADGKPIHEMSEPVGVRYEIDRSAWRTLPDLAADSGRIELPMYSFDSKSAQWVREADGELQDVDGKAVPESSLAAIRDESFEGDVFASFTTSHFSYFNCDAPISIRTCVKGRLVDAAGKAIAGVMVNVEGVSYQGDMGAVFTGDDGAFASDLIKTEEPDEDIDNNRRMGETFTARVRASSGTGVFVGATFDSPKVAGAVGSFGAMACQPQECSCVDLGDIEATFEPPRLCKISVHGSFSGKTLFGDEASPLAKGDAVVGAKLNGSMAGAPSMPIGSVVGLCAAGACKAAIDAEGAATFSVPMIGGQPDLVIEGKLEMEDSDGTQHSYTASATVTGCAVGEASVEGTVELAFDHFTGSEVDAFLFDLFGEVAIDDGGSNNPFGGLFGGGSDSDPKADDDPVGCKCTIVRPARSSGSGWASAVVAIGAFVLRRRRRRSARQGQLHGARSYGDANDPFDRFEPRPRFTDNCN